MVIGRETEIQWSLAVYVDRRIEDSGGPLGLIALRIVAAYYAASTVPTGFQYFYSFQPLTFYIALKYVNKHPEKHISSPCIFTTLRNFFLSGTGDEYAFHVLLHIEF